jgi:hypothetical protein
MKKLTLVAGLLFSSFSSLYAQDKAYNFSIRPTFGYAIGNDSWGILHGVGGSAEIQIDSRLSDKLKVYTSTGLGSFAAVGSTGKDSGTTLFPIMLGLEYDANKLHLGFGAGYTTARLGGQESTGGVSIRPEIGWNVSKWLQLNLNYNYTSMKIIKLHIWVFLPLLNFNLIDS